MANNTTSIPSGIAAFYDRNLLERAVPALIHDLFAQQRPLPSKSSKTIKFRRYNSLSAATTPLTEGVTPTGSDLSITDVTATIAQYGDFVVLNDMIDMTVEDNTIKEATDVLGEQAGNTIDQVLRDIFIAGTSVQQAASVATRLLTNTVPTTTDMDLVIKTLKGQNAKYFTELMSGTVKIGTAPIRPAFFGITHPNATPLFEALSGWKPVETYAAGTKVYDQEVGMYKNVRIIETTNAKVFTGLGAGGKDVYSLLVFAKNAVGATSLRGSKNIETYVKALGSAGTADPLNQRSTVGWKANVTGKILNNAFMNRYEFTLS